MLEQIQCSNIIQSSHYFCFLLFRWKFKQKTEQYVLIPWTQRQNLPSMWQTLKLTTRNLIWKNLTNKQMTHMNEKSRRRTLASTKMKKNNAEKAQAIQTKTNKGKIRMFSFLQLQSAKYSYGGKKWKKKNERIEKNETSNTRFING